MVPRRLDFMVKPRQDLDVVGSAPLKCLLLLIGNPEIRYGYLLDSKFG